MIDFSNAKRIDVCAHTQVDLEFLIGSSVELKRKDGKWEIGWTIHSINKLLIIIMKDELQKKINIKDYSSEVIRSDDYQQQV